jgi:hypothetical protein
MAEWFATEQQAVASWEGLRGSHAEVVEAVYLADS